MHNNDSWKQLEIAHFYRSEAESAERYLNTLPNKIKNKTSSYELLYDESLAKLVVYTHLKDSSSLSDRNSLLKELITMLDEKVEVGYKDHYRFEMHRKHIINNEIKKYELMSR